MRKKEDQHGSGKLRITVGQLVRGEKVQLAREFRRAPTPAEKKAWSILRNRGVFGFKFRRQQVIDGFVVDFYCAKLRVAIEIDGEVHESVEAACYDRNRPKFLQSIGITVVRVKNDEVTTTRLNEVLKGLVKT